MTLPFADKPGQSSIYQDLKTKTLQELTADQFDAFRARMLSQGTDGLEDEYRRLLLLGLASDKLSTSGPIPATSQVVTFNRTTSGGTPTLAFTPGAGEVWQFMGGSVYAFGISGTVVYEVYISSDAVFSDQTALQIINYSQTATRAPLLETNFPPIYLDSNTSMYVEATGTFTSVNFNLGFVRVR